MPKTKDAFAFADFDAAKILQRPYFRELDFNDLTDERIIGLLIATGLDDVTELEKKNQLLKKLRDKLADLCHMIQVRHAGYQSGRLEKLRRRLMKKIPAGTTDETLSLQIKINREQQFLIFYNMTVLPKVIDLLAEVELWLGSSESLLQMAYRRRFGERLRTARERAGLSRKDFAADCHITPNALHYYENGQREPSLTSLKRFARKLKTSTDSLLE